MNFSVPQRVLVDVAFKRQPLLMPVLLQALFEDSGFRHVHGRNALCDRAAFVIVGDRLKSPLVEWEPRSRAIQSLSLTLLIAGENDSMLG